MNKTNALAYGTKDGFLWIVKHNGRGYRLGYVAIPPTHPWYKIDLDDLDFCPHWGFTYSSRYKQRRWIGFDCNHINDLRDPALPGCRSRVDCNFAFAFGEVATIKTTRFCIGQCFAIIAAAKAVRA